MRRLLSITYSVVAYALFLVVFLYAIGFVGNLYVPRSIDSGDGGPWPVALAINCLLLASFAIQHSVMARRGFKRWWTQFIPKEIERSTYVLFATLLLALICWQWRAMPAVVWEVTNTTAVRTIDVVFWLGWAVLLTSTFLLNHFELFGLRQVFDSDPAANASTFRTPWFYRVVRHPLYLGFLISFWAVPRMTVGHLLFSIGTTGYILLGIWLEERDLVAQFGDRYRQYRARVGMLLPKLGRRSHVPETGKAL